MISWPVPIRRKGHSTIFIDDRGKPTFYITTNLMAAQTISTDEVWPGGNSGLALDGSGIILGRLGMWDGGGVLTTHQEFGGRVTQMDGPVPSSFHSTHVAGTMVATGVDPAARGMSHTAYLAAYNWINDFSEMAVAAAAGLRVSNHSYGVVSGWYWIRGDSAWYWFGDTSISPVEGYGFGFYSDLARDLDEIARNAPYYSIVNGVGNDRGGVGPDPGEGHYVWEGDNWTWSTDTREPNGGADGYECVGPKTTAKNIISVGAIYDIPGGWTAPGDAAMSTFSSWGPTDDGRIKPDIVANGIGLYSCIDASTSAYGSYSGVSMSTPNLSGSLGLLASYYETTHSNNMPLASTMKAVLIQTADEAGSDPGPDYRFGWGVMNAMACAELIQADSIESERILEESLANGETDQFSFSSNGSGPIRITLVWTDLPGTPPPVSLNPTTLMLVNDLDLRLEHVGTSTGYQPYVLDPVNPGYAATTGDNFRDNVEQIHIASPPAGQYVISVSHKGSLSSNQNYSLVRSVDIPPCADTDADGVCGTIDNCPETANPDQADADGDGVGDMCCCGYYTSGYTGNTDCGNEGKRSLADIARLIDRVYISKEGLCCEMNGNINGDAEEKTTLADITKLIDHVYISKTETTPCE
jgi:hypothetical protein